MNKAHQSWQTLRTGTAHKLLARDEGRDLQCDLMQLDPNTQLPAHRHPSWEWVYVLQGSLTDARGTFLAGDFIHNTAGSEHQVSTGADGAELFVVWCGRVENL
ncbi:MAG: anti-ECFsigma factor, ChrR [uncultured bacterium]|nr:MAG: anti-ECFsigma factor, ChrR [uncultured bacterium]